MHAIPEALQPLTAYRQWIVWILVADRERPGKNHKFPIDFRTGKITAKGSGGAHNPEIWTDAQTAIAYAAQFNSQDARTPYGVGFVFTANDPFWFLDIDGAYADGAWSEQSQTLLSWFPGACVEVSSSHKGLHVIGSGPVPPHSTDRLDLGLGFYTEKRFIALTGLSAYGSAATQHDAAIAHLVAHVFPAGGTHVAEGSIADRWEAAIERGPLPDWNGPVEDDKLLERAMRSRSASSAFGTTASFADLWQCNVEVLAKCYPDKGHGVSPFGQSEVDAALAQHLAFWTGKDAVRMERLMRASSLYREKWDERDDYLPRTILGAIDRQIDVLTDKQPEPVAGAVALPLDTEDRRQAPRATAVLGSTFLSIEQQIDTFAGCVYVQDQHAVLVPGGALLEQGRFRVMFGGYTMPMDTANERVTRDSWEAFTQHQAYRSPRADTTCFRPDLAPGEVMDLGGRKAVNTWWPIDVARQQGDVTPFLEHLAKLLPNERDRQVLLCYMAACVQHRGYKFQWAPVLQGVEGNGKTFLTLCVAEAIGARYVHWPKASKLAAQFNGWMRGKLFYAVEDIYVAGNRMDVIEELKPMITGLNLEIEGKGVDQVTTNICGNFMFNSNHKDAILKTRNDRRFAVFYTAQQEAWHLARDGMNGDYMNRLYNWAKQEGGFAMVADLLYTFPIPDDMNPAKLMQRAPVTTSTEQAIMATRGGMEQEIIECVEQGLPGFAGGWISTMMLDRQLERLGRARTLKRNQRHDMMVQLGYMLHPGLAASDGRVNNDVLPDGGKPRLYVRTDSPLALLQSPADIARAYQQAQGATQPQPVTP